MLRAVVASVVAIAASAALYLAHQGDDKSTPNNAYILENTVTHARLLPEPSTHAFSYPTVAFLLSLDALESHSLDLAGGWLFGYGGVSWRVTGLRSAAYLLPDSRKDGKKSWGIKEKLQEVLEQHGEDGDELGDVWTLTMPSYLGYEGINPLTVHYCYARGEERLAWVVFEIHNTFGEKHVHVLVPGVREDENRPKGFDHSWTIDRDFHVSPFNDRLGKYTIAISAPPPPRSPTLASSPPRPKIRIHLHAPADSPGADSENTSAVGPLKLTATQVARRAVPLTSSKLVGTLTRYPFALLLSFSRILYHAWVLHYVKRLDVFPRPDPKPAMANWGVHPRRVQPGQGAADCAKDPVSRAYGGVGWQDEGPLEAYSRRIAADFLSRRAEELRLDITLVSGDPSVPDLTFSPWTALVDGEGEREELVVYYTAPRFFTTLLLAPSPAHLLLLRRADDLFRVSSDELFVRVFSASSMEHPGLSWTQKLRASLLPRSFVSSAAMVSQHPLDSRAPRVLNALAVCVLHLADALEQIVFTVLGARFVPGTEPWRRWERAATHAS
ncbi:hypothetical protein BD311DRAFT_804818 [Dichomitus squalens]|uniref:DUF1365-domain-containing protein n=1 Tax=Dichomitus squalens TaxID=114155 RepID=A0A4Q9MYC6_9APHY|nr:hypothetical protein BD311DRAFT_804818 [Dichomitus squalens]